MTIHLTNEANRTELNLDFTKFFSTKYQTYIEEGEVKKGERLKHKEMMDNLVNVYISDEYQNEHGICAVDIVDNWFREASEELEVKWKNFDSITLSHLKMLNDNWKLFRIRYKFETTDPFIDKMNKFKGDKKKGLFRFKSGVCSVVSDSYFMVMYEGNNGLIENIDTKGRKYTNSPDKTLLNIYKNCVEKSEYLFKITPKALKSVKKLGIALIAGYGYDIPSITTWLGKDDVEVWKDSNNDNILLRQSDRDILLIQIYARHDEEEFIELEGLAL